MKAIIYCQEINTGMNKLNDIMKNYERMNIKIIMAKGSYNSAFVVFENKDEWTVTIANDGSRGRACSPRA